MTQPHTGSAIPMTPSLYMSNDPYSMPQYRAPPQQPPPQGLYFPQSADDQQAQPDAQYPQIQHGYYPQPDQQAYQAQQQQAGRDPFSYSDFANSLPQYQPQAQPVSQPLAPSDWEADGPYQAPPGALQAANGYAPQVQQPNAQPATLYASQALPSSRPSSAVAGHEFSYDGHPAYQSQDAQYAPQYMAQHPMPGSSAPMQPPGHQDTTAPRAGSALPMGAPAGQLQYVSAQPSMPAPAQQSMYVSQQQPVFTSMPMAPQQTLAMQQAPTMMMMPQQHFAPQTAPYPQDMSGASQQPQQQWLNEGIEM
jgi:hypothetical protein